METPTKTIDSVSKTDRNRKKRLIIENEVEKRLCQNCSRIHSLHSQFFKDQNNWKNVEYSVQLMDRKFGAQFKNWIKDSNQLSASLPILKQIIFDYDAEKIANGLRWLFIDWNISYIAGVLDYLFWGDFLSENPEFTCQIIEKIIFDWELKYVYELFNLLPLSPHLRLIYSKYNFLK